MRKIMRFLFRVDQPNRPGAMERRTTRERERETHRRTERNITQRKLVMKRIYLTRNQPIK
jgi:hypothetical protein